ncbi:MAG: ATP-binding protein [Fodinibius sp.]|nr:ATP-binding protein [Fodinibius sp.]
MDEPKVTITTTTNEEKVTITITDVGKRVIKKRINHVFSKPFFTTKEVGVGTGLGLSVSHGIINKIGGSIDVESTYGKGTSFIIQLPVENYDEDQICFELQTTIRHSRITNHRARR